MKFKQRMLEESFKDFIKNNAGLAAAGTGIGAGLLYNYLTGGADTELASNQAEMNNFMNKEALEQLVKDRALNKDEFETLYDQLKDAKTSEGWIFPDDSWFGDNNQEALAKVLAYAKAHPEVNLDIKYFEPDLSDGLHKTIGIPVTAKISGAEINTNLPVDQNYEIYQQQLREKLSPDIQKEIENNPDLAEKKAELQNSIEHSTRNSYLKKAALGGALATGLHQGGKFAKRKLNAGV